MVKVSSRPTVAYKPRPGEIPTNPGVYRFRDAAGRVLYVGKAKNLRARLSNYFAPLHTLHERTRRMVTSAASVEWTVVASDVDSLQLEYMWIKEFDPPFNVRYKDDKSYPFMAITLADEAPRVIVTRNRRIPGAKYFGPYPKVWAVHDTIDLMIKVFPIRTCSDASLQEGDGDRPAVLPGSDRPVRRALLDEGDDRGASGDRRRLHRLHGRRRPAVREGAQRPHARGLRGDGLRGRRRVPRPVCVSIDAVLSKSALVLSPDTDADLFGIAEDELNAAVQQFVIRGGRVRGVRATTIEKELDISGGELVDQVLQRAYGDAAPVDIPRQVLVPSLPDDAVDLEEWLRKRRGKLVSIQVAQRGRKAELLKTATLNAQQALMIHKTRRTSDYVARTQALTDLQEALGLAEAPLRIECFDVSHLSGTNVVASMVVFEDGLPRKDQYRNFGVPETTDDTDSLYQVLTRRLAYLDRPEEQDEPTARAHAGRRGHDDAQTASLRLPAAAARRGRRQAAGGGGGARTRRCRARRDRPVRHREATRRGVDAGGGVPRDPAPHERGAVPPAAPARRGAPVRDHPSASSPAP